MSAMVTAVLALADDPPADIDPTTGKGPEWGKAAPIGLLVILLMGIATFFLLRSMIRNLKKVPASFDPPAQELAESSTSPPDETGGSAPPDAEPPAGLVNERSG